MTHNECHHNSRQFTVKQTLTGKLVVMVRYGVVDISPATWSYGSWRPADITELPEILEKLKELNKE